ncbi:hypothetical protein D8Y31_24710 [Escherichia coli]|nr:hypothetical protein D8Y31_24710 [Escherichia coli]
MIVSRTKVDLLIQKKDLKQKNLLLKIDFIFLTQVKINLIRGIGERHWKRRDRCNKWFYYLRIILFTIE